MGRWWRWRREGWRRARWRRTRWRRYWRSLGGESKSSLSSSDSRRSSASLHLFLTRLAGGGATSGGDGDGVFAWAFSQAGAAVPGDDGCDRDRLSHAAVMAPARSRLARRRRRLFTVVAAGVEGSGRMHVRVKVCRPASWLKVTRALSPLSFTCHTKLRNQQHRRVVVKRLALPRWYPRHL